MNLKPYIVYVMKKEERTRYYGFTFAESSAAAFDIVGKYLDDDTVITSIYEVTIDILMQLLNVKR
jgi:hypothetical protein